MMNFPENAQPSSPEFKQFRASLAKASLLRQIGELGEEKINPSSSIFILGQLLARNIESSYLEVFIGNQAGYGSASEVSRIEAGTLQTVFQDAQNGDFKGLKKFAEEQSEDWKGIAETDDEPDTEEYFRDIAISKNLRLLAETLPESGDESLVQSPNPAWMQEPQALEEQLRILGLGGENS